MVDGDRWYSLCNAEEKPPMMHLLHIEQWIRRKGLDPRLCRLFHTAYQRPALGFLQRSPQPLLRCSAGRQGFTMSCAQSPARLSQRVVVGQIAEFVLKFHSFHFRGVAARGDSLEKRVRTVRGNGR